MGEQVSERESLAQHLRAADDDYQAREQSANAGRAKDEPGDWWEFMSDAALAWFAEHRGPRVVSTVEELDALPEHSVIRDRYGDIGTLHLGKVWYPETAPLYRYYVGHRYLPATVLFTPTTESEDR